VYLPKTGKYYRAVFELTNWADAKARCLSYGPRSRLVNIKDQAESQALKEYFDTFDREYYETAQHNVPRANAQGHTARFHFYLLTVSDE